MRLGLARAVAFAALAGCSTSPVHRSDATLDAHVVWTESADWFGGLSSITLGADGTALRALSDMGRLSEARITRDQGRITGVRITRSALLLHPDGTALDSDERDAEGQAVTPDGTLWVSFENGALLRSYAPGSRRGQPVPTPEIFAHFHVNKSLEALASDEYGRLYTLGERPLSRGTGFVVHRRDANGWSRAFVLPKRNGYDSTSADIGPDGRFYLLERKFSVLGFQSRLRRWDITEGIPSGETVLFASGPGTFDNLEGLSVWRDPQGRLRALMVSDDNYRRLQQTELVEFILPE
ncbi:MAG: esterase-like activity of phytase family protein [Rhodobacteraceae bacterium]|nr:esterase-like activity of phytase family protein [Paracoccaceae bacterium]